MVRRALGVLVLLAIASSLAGCVPIGDMIFRFLHTTVLEEFHITGPTTTNVGVPVALAVKVKAVCYCGGDGTDPIPAEDVDTLGGGNTLAELEDPRNFVWKWSPSDGAVVTRGGVFTATKPGTYTVSATLLAGSRVMYHEGTLVDLYEITVTAPVGSHDPSPSPAPSPEPSADLSVDLATPSAIPVATRKPTAAPAATPAAGPAAIVLTAIDQGPTANPLDFYGVPFESLEIDGTARSSGGFDLAVDDPGIPIAWTPTDTSTQGPGYKGTGDFSMHGRSDAAGAVTGTFTWQFTDLVIPIYGGSGGRSEFLATWTLSMTWKGTVKGAITGTGAKLTFAGSATGKCLGTGKDGSTWDCYGGGESVSKRIAFDVSSRP